MMCLLKKYIFMSIVYVLMYTIDVCYCIDCLAYCLMYAMGLLRGYGVILQNFTIYINTRGTTSTQRGTL